MVHTSLLQKHPIGRFLLSPPLVVHADPVAVGVYIRFPGCYKLPKLSGLKHILVISQFLLVRDLDLAYLSLLLKVS